jgi:hypothetical protein
VDLNYQEIDRDVKNWIDKNQSYFVQVYDPNAPTQPTPYKVTTGGNTSGQSLDGYTYFPNPVVPPVQITPPSQTSFSFPPAGLTKDDLEEALRPLFKMMILLMKDMTDVMNFIIKKQREPSEN